MKYITASIFFCLDICYFNTADITWNTGKKKKRWFRIWMISAVQSDIFARHRSGRNAKMSFSGTGVRVLQWKSTVQRVSKLRAYLRLWHLVLVQPWMAESLLCEPVSSTMKWQSCPKWFFQISTKGLTKSKFECKHVRRMCSSTTL